MKKITANCFPPTDRQRNYATRARTTRGVLWEVVYVYCLLMWFHLLFALRLSSSNSHDTISPNSFRKKYLQKINEKRDIVDFCSREKKKSFYCFYPSFGRRNKYLLPSENTLLNCYHCLKVFWLLSFPNSSFSRLQFNSISVFSGLDGLRLNEFWSRVVRILKQTRRTELQSEDNWLFNLV